MGTEHTILHFPADHACGAGHFPGNPIIPGALLLAETLRLVAGVAGLRLDSCNVKSAKFLHPVRPGDTVDIEFSLASRQDVHFQCAVSGKRVLTGVLSAATHA